MDTPFPSETLYPLVPEASVIVFSTNYRGSFAQVNYLTQEKKYAGRSRLDVSGEFAGRGNNLPALQEV